MGRIALETQQMDDRFDLYLQNEIGEIAERIDTIIKEVEKLNPEQEEEKPQTERLSADQIEITEQKNTVSGNLS